MLLVEDRDSLRTMLRSALEAEGFAVTDVADGPEAVEALGRRRFVAVITDLKLPRLSGHEVLEAARDADPHLPVVVMTAYGTIEDAVRAMKSGAFDFLAKPVEPDHLVLVLRRALERRALVQENLLLREEVADRLGFPRIVGESPALERASRQVRKVAPTDATVLIQGESGTGKELFARAVHHLSPRRERKFVAINCAAIPETLIENELFGHDKGAYTGADAARAGRLELADGGTVFLDEIGELGPAVQAKLLRVLQERAFERVGGTRTIEVDLRIVAASNRDLRREVAARRFREDLYFRLAVVTIDVPPLRERVEDIPALAAHFLDRFALELRRPRPELTPAALAELRAHAWPGNIRELQNCLERAVILAEGDRLEPAHLALRGTGRDEDDLEPLRRLVGDHGSLDEIAGRARDLAEKMMIERALAESGGNKTRAAQVLQVNYKRLLARVRELGIDPGES